MRIGMVSQWYAPETGAAAQPTAIAETLRELGHDVRVLTGFPNYPHGQIQPGYVQRWRVREERRGVQLLRVPLYPSHTTGAVRRALTFTSFAASASAHVGWLRDADVCLAYLTPATVGAAAMLLRRRHHVPYVLYVQDLWPDTVTASGFIADPRLGSAVEAVLHRMLRSLYAGADAVAAISPGMARTLTERGVPRERVHLVHNWVDEELFGPRSDPDPVDTAGSGGRSCQIMYAGSVGRVQGLDSALHALALLRDRPDIGLSILGDGVALPDLHTLAVRLGLEQRVRFLGSRPRADLPALMRGATAQLVSLADLPLFCATVPSKLQTSMAAGLPVVCAVAGDAADLTRRSGGGVVAAPADPASIAAAFRVIADLSEADRRALGRAGRRFYETELSAAVGSDRLERLLVDAGRSRRPGVPGVAPRAVA